jgi:hypothetical protein
MRLRTALRAAALALSIASMLLIGSGCGGGSDGPSDDDALGDDLFRLTAASIAQDALFTLDDLPSGWRAAPEDPAGDLAPLPDIQPSEECAALALDEDFPGATYEVESQEFDIGSEEDLTVSIGIYRTGDAAADGKDAYEQTFDDCRDEFVRLIEETVRRERGDVTFDVTLDSMDAPDLGDWSDGLRITMAATGPLGSVEQIYESITIRHGRVFGTISYASNALLDEKQAETLTKLFSTQLEEADAKLPA